VGESTRSIDRDWVDDLFDQEEGAIVHSPVIVWLKDRYGVLGKLAPPDHWEAECQSVAWSHFLNAISLSFRKSQILKGHLRIDSFDDGCEEGALQARGWFG
jgi:uncharacterized protein YqjF (DUF2071 family)